MEFRGWSAFRARGYQMAHNFSQSGLNVIVTWTVALPFFSSFQHILAGQRCLSGYVSELRMLAKACNGVDSNCYLNTYSFLLFSPRELSKRVKIFQEVWD